MLPAWLGAHKGLQQAIDDGQKSVLDEMSRQWPFFRTRLEMLEMVFLKADLWLAEYYDTRLVPENLWALGKQLRQELADSIEVVLKLRPQGVTCWTISPGSRSPSSCATPTQTRSTCCRPSCSIAPATTRRPCTPSWIRR